MNNDNRPRSIDGFVSGNTLPPPQPLRPPERQDPKPSTPSEEFLSPEHITSSPFSSRQSDNVYDLGTLDEDLRTLDKKPTRKGKRNKKPWSKRKKIVVWIVTILVAALLGIGGYLFIKSLAISQKVFHGGNVLDLLGVGTPLKTDAQGRTNIVLFGTSQDDAAHQGADGGGGLWLTDSIELVSIDQKAKTVKMVGIPRDLWTQLGHCAIGDYAKINAQYECGSKLYNNSTGTPGSNYSAQDTQGAQELMSSIATVTGITPQYFIHADYTVLKQAIDAVGGIDVNIVGDGASGIYDTNFDWDCPNGPYTCKNVYYPSNGTYHLNGTQALFLSRARADSGIYSYRDFGLAQGDFDRQANQQKILMAFKAKAATAGVLANPITVSKLLDAFGNNITMDISGGEMKTLLDFLRPLPASSITQVSLVDPSGPVVKTGMVDGQSVVIAASGLGDYSSIIDYLSKKLSTNPAVAEGATIDVYNVSGVSGAAATERTKLEQLGLTVNQVGDASSNDAGTDKFTLYDLSNAKMPLTLKQLESTLNVKSALKILPADITSNSDFVILVNQ